MAYYLDDVVMVHEARPLLLLVPFVVMILLVLHLALFRSRSSNKKMKMSGTSLPPSPPGLPIIGHLHLIGDPAHVSLRDLAGKHDAGTGLMLLRLGGVRKLVVSSPRAAKAILRTHDHVFASRPRSTVSDVLLYGSSDIGFCPYGEHWRQLKKLVTTHLFTVKKVRSASYSRARQQEVHLVMAKIREAASAGTAVDMSEMMNAFANDIVCRAVSGKFFRAEGRNKLFRELIQMNTSLFGGFSLEDYFPGLAKFTCSSSWSMLQRNKARECHKRWDDLLENIITDHETRMKYYSNNNHGEDQETDFIDVLLSVQQEYGITRDHIKAILMDMFGAGTDTSSLVLELAMAELMRHPHLMTKLQAELRKSRHDETVAEEDLTNTGYLRAVIKETLRLHPPAPLLLPHLSMADCEVDGYTIPSGTQIIVNAWTIGRDAESWGEKPEEFMPDRFMSGGSAAGIDVRGKHFELLPFGAGRRICPGLNFGLATVEIMLANLVYCFDWELPAGMDHQDIDLTEVFGLTVHPKDKLILVPKPRPDLYKITVGHSDPPHSST